MAPQFISREIKVTVSGEIKTPAAFRLGEQEYTIATILEAWHDYGFSPALRRRHWWQRHHRNYYRVKTTGDEVFEIYYDRGISLEHPEYKKWYLSRQL